MANPFRLLDQILRGEATGAERLRGGRVDLPIQPLLLTMLLLGVIFGACVGSYTPLRVGGSWQQVVASGVKIPLLFALTFLVTLPSLYVFSALVGCRLSLRSVVNLLLAMIGVSLAVCASLGPIIVFFAVSTDSYPFMLVLTVLASATGGFLGLAFLLKTLNQLTFAEEIRRFEALEVAARADSSADEPDAPPSQTAESDPRPKRRHDPIKPLPDLRARAVFRIWVLVFAVVGAQMSWVLRPFVGNPNQPFEWFRERSGNFFQAFWRALERLFTG